MGLPFTYHIYPLGDSALTIDFGNKIDEELNKVVLALFQSLGKQQFPEIIEIIPAYSSLSIFYDVPALKQIIPGKITVYEWMKKRLEDFLNKTDDTNLDTGKQINIPV